MFTILFVDKCLCIKRFCRQVIVKLDLNGNGLEIDSSKLDKAMKIGTKFTPDKFRYMCIIAGCDYLQSLPGIGLGKARKLFQLATNPDMSQVCKFYFAISIFQLYIGKVLMHFSGCEHLHSLPGFGLGTAIQHQPRYISGMSTSPKLYPTLNVCDIMHLYMRKKLKVNSNLRLLKILLVNLKVSWLMGAAIVKPPIAEYTQSIGAH